jgi:3-hydroxyacyl-CoA dehydrogenase
LTRGDRVRIWAAISGGFDDSGFEDREMVIEAVFEGIAVKRKVIVDLEQTVPDSCILASNSPTLSISRLQEAARIPERIVGAHCFSPVAKMRLLELIRGVQTERTGSPRRRLASAAGWVRR